MNSIDEVKKALAGKLDVRQSGRIENRAKFPVLLVAFDGAFAEGTVIKKKLDANWRNGADYITPLEIKTKDTGLPVKDIAKAAEEALDGELQRCLEAQGAFKDYNRAMVNYVVKSSESEFSTFMEVITQTSTLYGPRLCKVLYVLLDQKDKSNRKIAENWVAQINQSTEALKERLDGVYLLSNRLTDGRILNGDSVQSNYEIIGSLILLGASVSTCDQNALSWLFRRDHFIKTAAFVSVKKPTREIAVASLQGILEAAAIPKEQEDAGELAKLMGEVRRKLGLPGQITAFEEYFKDRVQPRLPAGSYFGLLPHNKDLWKKSLPMNELEAASYKTLGLFLEENYFRLIRQMPAKDPGLKEFRAYMGKRLMETFSFQERLLFFDKPDLRVALRDVALRDVTLPVVGTVAFGGKYERALASQAANETKHLLYAEEFKDALIETMKELHNEAARLQGYIQDNLRKVSNLVIADDGVYQNIEKAYTETVRKYLHEHSGRVAGLLKPQPASDAQFLDALLRLGEDVLDSLAVYKLPFEKELAWRLDKAGSALGRDQLIRNTLVDNIEQYGRLRILSSSRQIFHCYLGDLGTEFFIQLNSGLGEGERIFDLCGDDQVENIIVSSLDEPVVLSDQTTEVKSDGNDKELE